MATRGVYSPEHYGSGLTLMFRYMTVLPGS